MTKTVLGVLCLLIITVSSILLYDNLGSNAYAQNDPNLIPWNENRSIQFGDFQGMPNTFPDNYIGDRGDSFWAFTWTIRYNNWLWQITQNQPCMYTITAFDDDAYFDKSRSWIKSEHASDMYLLNHEQKHFDITEIQSRKINEIVANEFFGKQFACPSFSGQSQNYAINQKISQDLQPVFDQISQEMNQMNLDYDTQTNHGVDPQMQKEWDDYIVNSLEYYESYKDKQEIQLTQEEIEQSSTLTCPPDYPYLHSDGQCWNVSEEAQTSQTESLLYENKQYGFSIKYPSTWQKNEILERDNDKPNRITIVTFTPPSQTAFYMVGFAENDLTYKGLDDQQILNKMKKEIANDCSECQDMEFVTTETTTNVNGYKMYYAALTTTMVTDEGTLSPLIGYGFIPDGNDLWLISFVFFSQDDFEQISDEATLMGESFTIFDYKGTQQTGSDLDELNEKGLDLLHSEKYEEAISIFDEIIGKDPNDIYAYNNKGLALENLKKYDEALESFDKALEIDPTFVVTLYNKGLLLGDLERYREAIPYLDRALAIEPDDVDVLDEKGQTLASLGSHKEALEYYDKALAIEPDNTVILFDKGFSLAEIGRHDEAISYYDLVLEQDPKDAITLNNKGYSLYILGEYDEALVYLNNALEIDPDFTLAQENKELVLEEISGKKPEETQSGGCLIATATYGSELSPQVQQLRELRDNHLLQTESGMSFMSTFNQFYYSFSPTIADWERENPAFKEFVKITLTPMISSLSILNYVDIDSESSVLVYGISLIMLNVGMYFVAPVVVVHQIRKKF